MYFNHCVYSSSVQRFQSEQLNCAISRYNAVVLLCGVVSSRVCCASLSVCRHGGLRTSLAATLGERSSLFVYIATTPFVNSSVFVSCSVLIFLIDVFQRARQKAASVTATLN